MSEKGETAFDPVEWKFVPLRDLKYPDWPAYYEYKNHHVVDGTSDALRLNLYLTQDKDFITIWFGLLEPFLAETRLEGVEKPPDLNLREQYNEPLFRGFIDSVEAAKHILHALRLDRHPAPQRLSGGTDNRLRCDVIDESPHA